MTRAEFMKRLVRSRSRIRQTRKQLAARIEAARVMCHCPLHTLFPQRIADLTEPTLLDMQAACDLIGKDTYGKPHWTPETISPCNPVVQAFARHALATRKSHD